MLENFFQAALNTPHTVKFVGYTYHIYSSRFCVHFERNTGSNAPASTAAQTIFPTPAAFLAIQNRLASPSSTVFRPLRVMQSLSSLRFIRIGTRNGEEYSDDEPSELHQV